MPQPLPGLSWWPRRDPSALTACSPARRFLRTAVGTGRLSLWSRAAHPPGRPQGTSPPAATCPAVGICGRGSVGPAPWFCLGRELGGGGADHGLGRDAGVHPGAALPLSSTASCLASSCVSVGPVRVSGQRQLSSKLLCLSWWTGETSPYPRHPTLCPSILRPVVAPPAGRERGCRGPSTRSILHCFPRP